MPLNNKTSNFKYFRTQDSYDQALKCSRHKLKLKLKLNCKCYLWLEMKHDFFYLKLKEKGKQSLYNENHKRQSCGVTSLKKTSLVTNVLKRNLAIKNLLQIEKLNKISLK